MGENWKRASLGFATFPLTRFNQLFHHLPWYTYESSLSRCASGLVTLFYRQRASCLSLRSMKRGAADAVDNGDADELALEKEVRLGVKRLRTADEARTPASSASTLVFTRTQPFRDNVKHGVARAYEEGGDALTGRATDTGPLRRQHAERAVPSELWSMRGASRDISSPTPAPVATSEEPEPTEQAERGAYAEVNSLLRLLHFERKARSEKKRDEG